MISKKSSECVVFLAEATNIEAKEILNLTDETPGMTTFIVSRGPLSFSSIVTKINGTLSANSLFTELSNLKEKYAETQFSEPAELIKANQEKIKLLEEKANMEKIAEKKLLVEKEKQLAMEREAEKLREEQRRHRKLSLDVEPEGFNLSSW